MVNPAKRYSSESCNSRRTERKNQVRIVRDQDRPEVDDLMHSAADKVVHIHD